MTRIGSAAGLAVILLSAVSFAATSEAEESTCISCHEAEEDAELSVSVPEWRDSVHATHEVSCDACHGGDPRAEDPDESMSEEAGFLDTPSWLEMADFCGVCHEAIAASYTAGRFGQMLREGTRVATCATCHMSDGHRILPAKPEEILTDRACPTCPRVDGAADAVKALHEVGELELAISELIHAVEAKGIVLTDLRGDLRQMRARFGASVHEFDHQAIDVASALTLTQLRDLRSTAGGWDREASRRRRYGVVVLSVLAVLFAALLRYRKQTS